jgi:hypothetical protein
MLGATVGSDVVQSTIFAARRADILSATPHLQVGAERGNVGGLERSLQGGWAIHCCEGNQAAIAILTKEGSYPSP